VKRIFKEMPKKGNKNNPKIVIHKILNAYQILIARLIILL